MTSLIRRLALLAVVTVGGFALAQQPVVVMQSADAKTLDPTMNRETSTFNVLLNIFDGLLFKNPDGSYSPALATSWKAVNPTTWRLELRHGVTFQNGEPFDANAVKFTIDRILDPTVKSPIARGFSFISSVDVVDPYTIVIHTKTPQPLAEEYFAELLIVPPTYFQKVGAEAFAKAPIGTGPYEVVSWKRDDALTLKANPNYWRGPAAIKNVVFKPVPEALTRFSSLSAGQADLITQVPPSLVSSIRSAPGVRLETVDGDRVIYIGINETKGNPALKDARVRRALNLAVNRKGIVQGIFGGLATPTTAMLTSIDFGYNPNLKPYPYDPAKAKQLLAEAGYAHGLKLTLGTPNGRYVNDVQVAQAVASQLEAVGITVNLQVREYGAYVGALFSGKAPDLYLIGWGNAPFDADYIYYNVLRSNQLLSYFHDPVLDGYLDTGHDTVDRAGRKAAYLKATQRIYDQAPVIDLYKQQDAYGVSDRLQWKARADEFIWMYSASLKP